MWPANTPETGNRAARANYRNGGGDKTAETVGYAPFVLFKLG
jgi:hypothetical protein